MSRKKPSQQQQKETEKMSAPAEASFSAADTGGNSGEESHQNNYQDSYEESYYPKPKKKKRFGWVLAIVVLLAAGGFIYTRLNGQALAPQTQTAGDYDQFTAERRDIIQTLSGSASLSPAESYVVTSLVSGEILSAPFEEGDMVEKDSLLFEVDASTLSGNIEKAEISLRSSQRNYEKITEGNEELIVTADTGGYITALDIAPGDDIMTGASVATVRDTSAITLKLYFTSAMAANFSVGDTASVMLLGFYETVMGTVTDIGKIDLLDIIPGSILREITIEFANPGAIPAGQEAYAEIGGVMSVQNGNCAHKSDDRITAPSGGTIDTVEVAEGDYIEEGDILYTLSAADLNDQLQNARDSVRNAELSLESQYDQLSEYTIESPIAGTIVQKDYKEGDALSSGRTLCTIFDLSYLTVTLNIDELDISKVEVGQEVTITADALAGNTYRGYVTKININGTTQSGVTSYPVTIRIDETEGLLPGMNVQASIVVESQTDVVSVPVSALLRGNRIAVKTDSAEAVDGLPAGFAYVEVTPGISDGDFIAITDGLKEGDVVAVEREVIPTNEGFSFMGGGGMPSGGAMPSGEGQMIRMREE